MNNFNLVVGNAGPREKSSVIDRLLRVQPRIYSTPKTKEYDLVMPSMSPIARLRRWRNRELGGPRMRMGLWLEILGAAKGPLDGKVWISEASGVRIDLRLTATPAPQRCRLVLANDRAAQFWSYSTDETAFVSIQLPEYAVYPSTSNYVGVVEWQWDEPFGQGNGGCVESVEISDAPDSGLFRITGNSGFRLESKLCSTQSGMTEVVSSEYRTKRV